MRILISNLVATLIFSTFDKAVIAHDASTECRLDYSSPLNEISKKNLESWLPPSQPTQLIAQPPVQQAFLDKIVQEAQQNDISALYTLAFMHQTALGVPKNLNIATELYRRAAEQGCLSSQLALGSLCLTHSNIGKQRFAHTWFRRAAKQNCPEAQYKLGLLYAQGHGVIQDEVKALKWISRAAELNYPEALYCLGNLYDTGRIVEKDDELAIRYFRKAAVQGDPASLTALASLLLRRESNPKEILQSLSYLELAAAAFYAPAEHILGHIYITGTKVAKDVAKGSQYILGAANQGYANAQVDLSYLLFMGIELPKDEIKALEWLAMAAIQGHKEARALIKSLCRISGTPSPLTATILPKKNDLDSLKNALDTLRNDYAFPENLSPNTAAQEFNEEPSTNFYRYQVSQEVSNLVSNLYRLIEYIEVPGFCVSILESSFKTLTLHHELGASGKRFMSWFGIDDLRDFLAWPQQLVHKVNNLLAYNNTLLELLSQYRYTPQQLPTVLDTLKKTNIPLYEYLKALLPAKSLALTRNQSRKQLAAALVEVLSRLQGLQKRLFNHKGIANRAVEGIFTILKGTEAYRNALFVQAHPWFFEEDKK
ncbi:tetratricopeptide repeat protein [Candidatus Odyssella thessalonicensis]|uniref:tetratricopeptide repeat protein n=1 Tax=Candidatus Odyssella thessalonicensis TaxID=84647 RepID=UPI000225A949|nr:SEL1-like repeat protein [Candidatus Odyssella thessalonicensis]